MEEDSIPTLKQADICAQDWPTGANPRGNGLFIETVINRVRHEATPPSGPARWRIGGGHAKVPPFTVGERQTTVEAILVVCDPTGVVVYWCLMAKIPASGKITVDQLIAEAVPYEHDQVKPAWNRLQQAYCRAAKVATDRFVEELDITVAERKEPERTRIIQIS